MIDKTKITKEILEKAAKCETAEQLIALAKKEGFDITKA
ncbi:MAG: Nif11 family protein [Spirochaetia bacterium]|nr:Nif11 family protein [Spirochaetales bacterium]MBR5928017.1 Nif11 family protein [Spirochaetia bacterium]